MTDTPDRLLAEMHIARQLSQTAPSETAASSLIADLWTEVRRDAATPISLTVARTLRSDPVAQSHYAKMLAATATAFAPVALAASDGIVERNIGASILRLLPAETDGVPLLVIEAIGTARALDMLGEDGDTLRLPLPDADDGTIVLSLSPDMPDAATALSLLRNPATALYLLP